MTWSDVMALPDLTPDDWATAAKQVIDHAQDRIVAPLLGTLGQQSASVIAALKDTRDWVTQERQAIVGAMQGLQGWLEKMVSVRIGK